jgi:hypothetical protein
MLPRDEVPDRVALRRTAHRAQCVVVDCDPVFAQHAGESLGHLARVFDRRAGHVENNQSYTFHRKSLIIDSLICLPAL